MVMTYSATVRTRTVAQDYEWIGGHPEEWWTTGWGSNLLQLRPCLLHEAGHEGRVLLTGIQSGRYDFSQARITYDLTFTPNTDGLLTASNVDALVLEWWRQRKTEPGQTWHVGEVLDRTLARTAKSVGQTLDSFLESASPSQIQSAILEIAERFEVPPSVVDQLVDPQNVLWVGSDAVSAKGLILGPAQIAYFASITPEMMQEPIAFDAETIVIVDGDSGVHHRRPKALTSAPKPRREGNRDRQLRKGLLVAAACLSGLIVLYLALRAIIGGRA
jgi:hypothetical protein